MDSGMNEFVFITYSNHVYAERMKQLLAKADDLGIRSRGYTREWLEQTEFYQQQKHILDQPRGNGYWLWKPYIIYDAICQANPGDIIFYLDCGDDYSPDIFNYVRTNIRSDQPGLLAGPGWPLKQFCKRDCFVYTDSDTPEYHNLYSCEAGMSFWNVSAVSKAALETLIEYSCNEIALTDLPNQSGLPDLPGFQIHQCDQSILTIVAHKYNWPIDRNLLNYVAMNVWMP